MFPRNMLYFTFSPIMSFSTTFEVIFETIYTDNYVRAIVDDIFLYSFVCSMPVYVCLVHSLTVDSFKDSGKMYLSFVTI